MTMFDFSRLHFSKGTSITQKMIDTDNRATGFDYLRLILSISIILWHSFEVVHPDSWFDSAWASPMRFFLFFLVPSFFCLSGFLVAGSLFRVNKISIFLTLRGMRIYPALIAEVLLSAFLIGPILTYDTLHTYFSSKIFFSYLLNVFGDVHFHLPGVFINNPIHVVNGQLWTIPYELKCYIAIVVLYLFGILKRRNIFLIFIAALTMFMYILSTAKGRIPTIYVMPTGHDCLISFLMGIAFFLYRDKIHLNTWLLILSIVIYVLCLMLPGTEFLAVFPIAYITIYLGLLNPKKINLLASGDYSYGLYLYGYPCQQVICQLFPQHRTWYFNFVLSMILTGIVAFYSWRLIESKVLGHKKVIISFVEKYLNKIYNSKTYNFIFTILQAIGLKGVLILKRSVLKE